MKALTIMNHCTIFFMLFLTGCSIFPMNMADMIKQQKNPARSYTIHVTDPRWGFYNLTMHSKNSSYPSLPSNADTIISNYCNALDNAVSYPTKSEAPGDYYDFYGQEAKGIAEQYKKDHPWLENLDTTSLKISEPVTTDFSDPVSPPHEHALVTMSIKEETPPVHQNLSLPACSLQSPCSPQQIILAPILPDEPDRLPEKIIQTAPIKPHPIRALTETSKPIDLQAPSLNPVPRWTENTPKALPETIVKNFFATLDALFSRAMEESIQKQIQQHPELMTWPIRTIVDPKNPNHIEMKQYNEKDNFSLLHYAANAGFIGLTNYLIEQKPDLINMVSNKGITPLLSALRLGFSGHLKCVKALLTNGAQVNHETPEGSGVMCFVSCLSEGNLEGAQIMIDHKACFKKQQQIILFYSTYLDKMHAPWINESLKQKITTIKNLIIDHCIKIGNIQETGKGRQGNPFYQLVNSDPFTKSLQISKQLARLEQPFIANQKNQSLLPQTISEPNSTENTPNALPKPTVTDFFKMLRGKSSKEKEDSILHMIHQHPFLKRFPVKAFDPKDPCAIEEMHPSNSDNFSLLHYAAGKGYDRLVKQLIIDCPDLINMATKKNIIPIVSSLGQDNHRQLECLRLLLENGAHFHQENNTSDKSTFLGCIWIGNILGAQILIAQKEAYFTTPGQISLFFGSYKKRINQSTLKDWVKEKIEKTKNIIIDHCLSIGNIQENGKDSQGYPFYQLVPSYPLTQSTQKRKREPESHPENGAKKQRLNPHSLSPAKQEPIFAAHNQLLPPTTQAGLVPPTSTFLEVPQEPLSARIANQFLDMLKTCSDYDKAKERQIINLVKAHPQLMTWPIAVVDDNNIPQLKTYSTDDNFSFLNCAVHLGFPQLTQYLIEKKPELINRATENGTTPLCSVMRRSTSEHIKCLKLLIENGAHVNQVNPKKIHKTALNQALLHGNIKGTRLLLRNGACFTHEDQLRVFMKAFQKKQADFHVSIAAKARIRRTKELIIDHLVNIKNIAVGQDKEYHLFNNTPHETRKIIQYEPYQESI
jgi:ankyrin repeat protein